jgi:Divergent InlB B-repeat domain
MGPDRRPRYLSLLILSLSFLVGLAWSGTAEAQLTLQWTDNSNNEDGFKIERKLGAGGTFQQVSTTGPNATSFADTGLSNGTTYCYRLRAFNAGGDSSYTNEACGTTRQVFNLSVVRAGGGSGSVTSSPVGITCGASCSASFTSGTPVTLTASPAAGSTFAGWSGGGCSGTGTCTVTLTAATSVTATFQMQVPAAPGNLTVQ